MKTPFLVLFLLLINAEIAVSQDAYPDKRTEMGLNMTSLIRRIPLFPQSEFVNGEYAIMFKRPRNKKSSYHRMSIGGAVAGREFENSTLQFSYGIERRRNIFGNWHFVSGIDFSIFIVGTNSGTTSTGIGFSPFVGAHLQINERIYLSAESNLYVATSTGELNGISAFIRPLNGLTLNFRL